MPDDFTKPIAAAQEERADGEADAREQRARQALRTRQAIAIIRRGRTGLGGLTGEALDRATAEQDRQITYELAQHGLTWKDCDYR